MEVKITECTVALKSDITNYWPGKHDTAFLVIFDDAC